jgi:hypothetical protein
MPYREEDGALKARRLSLQMEIDALEHRAREFPYLELRRGEVERQLAALPDPDAKPPLSPRERFLVWGTTALMMALVVGGAIVIVHRIHPDHDDELAAPPKKTSITPMISQPEPSPTGVLGQLIGPAAPIDAYGISIDFVGTGTMLGGDDVAGIAPLRHWNALFYADGKNGALVDSAGAWIDAMQIAWTSGGGWYDPQVDTANSQMFSGFIEPTGDPGVGGTVVVSVSRLPDALTLGKYAVVVYSDKMVNPADQVTRLEITAGSVHQAFYLRDAAHHDYPLRDGTRGFVVATGTRDDRMQTPVANCAIFKGLSAPDFEIKVSTTPRTSNNTLGYLRSPINGMQILPMAALSKIEKI